MDPDPAIFFTNLQDANKKLIKKKIFFCLLLFEGTFTSFLLIKGSGSIPLTNGSRSGRTKYMWIRNTDINQEQKTLTKKTLTLYGWKV
jgi:hypothetical protein